MRIAPNDPTDWKKKYEKMVEQVTELQKQLDNEKPLSERERHTFNQLVVGMAVAGYRYKPGAIRNSAVPDIEGDLRRLGIPLSDDTIRKYISQAAEILSPEVLESLES